MPNTVSYLEMIRTGKGVKGFKPGGPVDIYVRPNGERLTGSKDREELLDYLLGNNTGVKLKNKNPSIFSLFKGSSWDKGSSGDNIKNLGFSPITKMLSSFGYTPIG